MAAYNFKDLTGQRFGRLVVNAHHIEAFAGNPELRTELSNGITFCEKCHKDFHHQYGRGKNTRKQLDEFMSEVEHA